MITTYDTVKHTPEEYRADAADARERAAESFERCDTDGFMSQWAAGQTAGLADAKARLAEQGWKSEFPALFDLDGRLVPAKLIDTQFGESWALIDPENPKGRFLGFVNPSKARKASTRHANLEKKGYRVGTVRAAADAELRGHHVTNVGVVVYRTDGGYSADVEIVSTENAPWELRRLARGASLDL